jgi:hypothetical protein
MRFPKQEKDAASKQRILNPAVKHENMKPFLKYQGTAENAMQNACDMPTGVQNAALRSNVSVRNQPESVNHGPIRNLRFQSLSAS